MCRSPSRPASFRSSRRACCRSSPATYRRSPASASTSWKRPDWRSVLGPALLFVASFSAVFILLGLTATAIGSSLQEHQELLSNIGAVLLIVMGALFIGAMFIDRLNREWHFDALLARAGKGGPISRRRCVLDCVDAVHGVRARRHPGAREHPGRRCSLRSVPADGLLAWTRDPVLAHGPCLLPRDDRLWGDQAPLPRHHHLRRRHADRDGDPDPQRRLDPAEHLGSGADAATSASTNSGGPRRRIAAAILPAGLNEPGRSGGDWRRSPFRRRPRSHRFHRRR